MAGWTWERRTEAIVDTSTREEEPVICPNTLTYVCATWTLKEATCLLEFVSHDGDRAPALSDSVTAEYSCEKDRFHPAGHYLYFAVFRYRF